MTQTDLDELEREGGAPLPIPFHDRGVRAEPPPAPLSCTVFFSIMLTGKVRHGVTHGRYSVGKGIQVLPDPN